MNKNGVHNSLLKTTEAIDILVIVLCIVMSQLLPLSWPGPQALWPNILISTCLAIPGVRLIIRSRRDLETAGQKAEPGYTTTDLVTTGIFARTRNPIYLASLILYVAAGFAFRTLWPIILVPLAALVFYYWLIRPEEQFLSTEFGEAYQAYCSRVGRWWTFK